MVLNTEHHLSVHLDKTAIAVIGEALVAAFARQPLDDTVVEPEVEHRVHHARHRNAGTRADRDEKRIVGISEACAERVLDLGERAFDLFAQLHRIRFIVLIKIAAGFGSNRQPGRHRQPEITHLGEARPLSTEQISQVSAALGGPIAEPVDPFLHLPLTLRSARSRQPGSSSHECATTDAGDWPAIRPRLH